MWCLLLLSFSTLEIAHSTGLSPLHCTRERSRRLTFVSPSLSSLLLLLLFERALIRNKYSSIPRLATASFKLVPVLAS
ncbi:hypothetical protein BGY98DRAFT_958447 [Russula aff. rugulosa BPL654]|nr:hypothetical protein BGY98DRAFT_958447 [Russula aff. rugulosa BPL654]